MKENQRCLTSSWLKTSMFKLFGVFNNFSWHMSMTLLSPIWTTSADMIMKITSYHACHTKQSAWSIRSSLSWKDFMTETVTMSECGITPLADPWNHSFTLQRRWRWWRHEPENSKKKKISPWRLTVMYELHSRKCILMWVEDESALMCWTVSFSLNSPRHLVVSCYNVTWASECCLKVLKAHSWLKQSTVLQEPLGRW